MRSLRERCLGRISDSRREKEKENQQARRAVTNEVASNPFGKAVLAGRPMWPTNIRIPTTRHIWEKAKERRERKENQNSNIPMMETRVNYLSYDSGKGKGGQEKWKSKTFAAIAENGGAARHPADCTIHRACLCRLDRSRLGSIMELE